MKPVSVFCAYDRVVLARRGLLSRNEWRDFSRHLRECVDCRVAWQLGCDFDESAPARPGDEDIVARGVRKAHASRARPRLGVPRVAVAALALLIAVGVASAAIVLHERRARLGSSVSEDVTSKPSKPRGPRRFPTAAAKTDEQAPAAKADIEAPSTEPPQAAAQQAPSAPPLEVKARSALRAVREDRPATDATQLFSRALAEREQGKVDDAISTFRALQGDFPQSREATVSLVSLGELLSAQGRHDEALRAFDAYLLRKPAGPLAHEALVGKGLALEALALGTAAESTWRDLAGRFPKSPYAARAGKGVGP